MPLKKFFGSLGKSTREAGSVTSAGLKTVLGDPQILVYAYLAVAFVWLTSPLVTRFVLDSWRHFNHPQVINHVIQGAPHPLLAHLGIVAFPVFYTFFVTAYFTCAVSASVLAKLNHQSTSPLYGLGVVGRRFGRVTWFAILAIFFFPLGIIAQRRKLPKGIIGVIGSSFTLSMAQLAPAVVSHDEGVFATVCQTIETLGKLWKESLVIRVGTILATILLGLLSFLPKVIEHYWFNSSTAHVVGWVATALLGAGVFIVAKVLSTVLTTTLYYKADHKVA